MSHAGNRVTAVGGTTQTIAAVERAADVLLVFREQDRAVLGVTEISELTGFSKAVVHRILNSLRLSNFITFDPESKRYGLGPAAVALGLTYLEHLDVRGVAKPLMIRLGEETGETITLSMRNGWERTYIDQVTPAREVRMVVQLGQTFPLHAGASSKAMLAALGDDEVEAYLAGDLAPITERTVVDRDALRTDIAAIRDRGYSVSSGERLAGATAVGAAILDHEGSPVAAMSVAGPAERFEDVETVGPLLVTMATTASRALGHRA
jgi:IclR family acetate operon transcriptional repressor